MNRGTSQGLEMPGSMRMECGSLGIAIPRFPLFRVQLELGQVPNPWEKIGNWTLNNERAFIF
jgi:hypothetical protein